MRKTYAVCAGLFAGSLLVAFLGLDHSISERFEALTAPASAMIKIAGQLAGPLLLFPICALVGVALWVKKRRSVFLPALGIVAYCAGQLTTYVLKHVVGRPRPYLWHQHRVTLEELARFHWFNLDSGRDYLSFPSADATAVFAVAWIISRLPETTRAVRIPLFLLATALGLGRITLDLHFAGDIVAGAAVGIVSAQAAIDLFAKALERYGARLVGASK
jgi:undecaprenyl-diphosphatase